MFLQSQKFTLLDEVIYHQVIPSFWKWQLLYYSSASQILADFGTRFVETQARLPTDLLIFVICARAAGLLAPRDTLINR